MKRWSAHEHDDTGWPTESYVVAMAETRDNARRMMGEAIAARAAAVSREMNVRIWAIFIEAPNELANDDPRGGHVIHPGTPAFHGFDEPPEAPSAPLRIAVIASGRGSHDPPSTPEESREPSKPSGDGEALQHTAPSRKTRRSGEGGAEEGK